MSFEYLQEVSNDFENLLETDEEYDVIIYAGENEDLKEIHAHSLVYVQGHNIFVRDFLRNGLRKRMENLFLKSLLKFLTSF